MERKNEEKEVIEKAKEAFNQIDASNTAKAQKFNVKSALAKMHTVNDAELGKVVFGELTIKDAFDAAAKKDMEPSDKALYILYLMLKKGDKQITFEDVQNLPANTATKLLNITGKSTGFLPKESK
jgi:hypothetical protein